MSPAERHVRNTDMLTQCYPWLQTRLTLLLHDLEQEGYAPRIQCAWRSPAAQREAFHAGTSKLTWGYHNATAPDGTPEALAVDIVEDAQPLSPPLAYLLRLAYHAEQHGLITGIRWGLPKALARAVDGAILVLPGTAPETLKTGWDSCHCEVTGLTVAQARAGLRPP